MTNLLQDGQMLNAQEFIEVLKANDHDVRSWEAGRSHRCTLDELQNEMMDGSEQFQVIVDHFCGVQIRCFGAEDWLTISLPSVKVS